MRLIRIPYPGWQTIARVPRVALPPSPPPTPAPRAAPSRASAFRVLRWTRPEPAAGFGASRRPMIIDLFADAPSTQRRPPPRGDKRKQTTADARSNRLARRIDALSRVLANPEPVVRRLARLIASFPAGLLQPAEDVSTHRDWRHGHPEFADICSHLRRAINALYRLEPG